jgi:hypothetical protein
MPQRRCYGRNPGVLRDESAGADAARSFEAGDPIDEFLAGFPSVSREQVIAFLEAAADRLVEAAE